jgi:hypothetical protein
MGRTRRAADAAGWRFFSGWGFATAPSLALAELGHLLHILIAHKLQDGRLPRNSVPRVLGGPGKGEACDACGASIAKEQLGIEGIALAAGGGSSRGVTDRRRNQFVSLMRLSASHAARRVACQDVRSHAVSVALVRECSIPVV